ncbi:MAG: hypothetical protein DRG78_06760 [Epsilonproteobacteria bacterium]|nr:MAG: hypothetical protein DRG78_06760 [Campylobacterota bacterium]
MKFLELNKENIIAKGGERNCYLHPLDNKKLIKIIHAKGKHGNQNKLEQIYMSYLNKNQIDLSHIAKYYGEVDTNIGTGLIYEKIMDYDNKETKSLRYYVAKNQLPNNIDNLIDNLKLYLEKNNILFVDNGLINIFCQKITKDKYKLVIIDGLGAKRFGLKFWFYMHSKIYTRYKIKKQWIKFIKTYKKDIERAKLGINPITRY